MTDKHRPGELLHTGTPAPRFHRAHSSGGWLGEEGAADPNLIASTAGKGEDPSDQLRRQAAELAEYLRERHGQVTRRQAGLNARLAEYEAQHRAAQLWLRERHHELDTREAELQQQRRQLEEQRAQSQARDHTMESLARREEQVRQSEQAIEAQRRQVTVELEHVREQQAWLEAACASWRHQAQEEKTTLDQLRKQLLGQRQAAEELNARLRERLARNERDSERAEHLNQREQQIDGAATRVRAQEAALERQRQAWSRERELQSARIARQRRTIAACWRRRRQDLQRERQELKDRRQAIRKREDQLRQQQESVDAHGQEVGQRELVVQHAYDAIRRQISPAEFSRLEQAVRHYVRGQLATAEKTIAARKQELHQWAGSLRQQQQTLKLRYARLHAATACRPRDLDAQTAELDDPDPERGARASRAAG